MLTLRNSALVAMMAAAMVMTGCANKRNSQVVVSPVGVPGVGQGAYRGGPLVSNSAAIQSAAANLRATVHFDYDSDAIKPEAAAILDQHVQLLTSNPSARVQVAGHTDERGSREYNMSLGERRAAAVRAYLSSKGVSNGNVEIVSYGEEQPAATGSGESAWAQNRRAELSY